MEPRTTKISRTSYASNNILNQTIYNPVSQLPMNEKLWWESFGMFFLIILICQLKPVYGFDLWISSLLPVVIMLSVKQSGAHYNPTMTVSNFLIKFGPAKIDTGFIWAYFKADFVPAFVAYNIGFYTRAYYYPPPIPSPEQSPYQIILSEFIGSFMLVFLLQKIGNSQTTFTTSQIQTYSFIVPFVYIARKFAVMSGNSINPVATFACVCAAVLQCQFQYFQYFYLYFFGDMLGSVLGSWFYNCMIQPALRISRKERQQQNMRQSQEGPQQSAINYPEIKINGQSGIKIVVKLIQEEEILEINKLTKIEHRSDVYSDQVGDGDEDIRILEDVRFSEMRISIMK